MSIVATQQKQQSQQPKSLIDLGSIRKSVGPNLQDSQAKGSQNVFQVRKPKRSDFVRVHPDECERYLGAHTVEDPETRELYLITGQWEMPSDVSDFETAVNLYRAMNHHGIEFLWFFKGTTNDWSLSATMAVREATEKWIRLRPNMSASSYEISKAPEGIPEPKWSNRTFQEILSLAFEGRVISTPDHKVIRLLQGKTHGLGQQ